MGEDCCSTMRSEPKTGFCTVSVSRTGVNLIRVPGGPDFRHALYSLERDAEEAGRKTALTTTWTLLQVGIVKMRQIDCRCTLSSFIRRSENPHGPRPALGPWRRLDFPDPPKTLFYETVIRGAPSTRKTYFARRVGITFA